MAVISFASHKGGVGKTSCAINLAHALAKRGCEVVMLDLDPLAQATRFFRIQQQALDVRNPPLVQLLSAGRLEWHLGRKFSLLQAAAALGIKLWLAVRESLYFISGGCALPRLLLDAQGKRTATLLPLLLEELGERFDFVINDLAPHYSFLAEVVLGASDAVVVPVDMSLMSIWGLEQLAEEVSRFVKPTIAVLRTMVNRQASRVRALNESRLRENLVLQVPAEPDAGNCGADLNEAGLSLFLGRVAEYERLESKVSPLEAKSAVKEKPIYLLDSIIYRTEIHNRLGFMGQTAFDGPLSRELADSYLQLAREIEKLVALADTLAQPAVGLCKEKGVMGT